MYITNIYVKLRSWLKKTGFHYSFAGFLLQKSSRKKINWTRSKIPLKRFLLFGRWKKFFGMKPIQFLSKKSLKKKGTKKVSQERNRWSHVVHIQSIPDSHVLQFIHRKNERRAKKEDKAFENEMKWNLMQQSTYINIQIQP